MRDSEKTEFVPIEGCPPYEISRNGEIRSKKTGLVVKWQKMGDVQGVTLFCGEEVRRAGQTKYVHRLLAETFLEKPVGWDSTWKATFKNNDKTDLSLSNLAWMTRREAYKHVRAKGTR
jgi:hypothetical protein